MAAGAQRAQTWARTRGQITGGRMPRDYGRDVLAGDWRSARRPPPPEIEAERGLVVEEAHGSFCGAVVECAKDAVTLEDRFGKQRVFPLERGAFLLDGQRVTLIRP